MTLDLKAAASTLNGLRPFPVAVTTILNGRANGLMSLSAGAASIVPEAPRVTISLTKYNLTHDLVLESGVFAMHLLAATPEEQFAISLDILMGLGGSSGRDGDKISKFRTKPGVTGTPILLDALSYVEGRVVHSLDIDESTLFVADVVAAEQLHDGERLRVGPAWGALPKEWIEQYDRNHEPQLESARKYREQAKS
ncbi:flavin reductase family protein [Frankia sp. QA3]|uniref:flavin reductase family protein n=1 Tax=Frankia sp. QA3 TaxID=710111 RepID=UPI000269BE3A|nr:flavin reductase family protein [Frankia sp. QA3]EIV91873.1 DIM6/NTAB family protein [Frankia sp. QA3]